MNCPACGGSGRRNSRLVIRQYTFLRCRECSSLFCTDAPDVAATADVYAGDSYFKNPVFESPETGGYHGYKDYLSDREHIERKFSSVLAHVESFRAPGSLLDVGAGPGFLLSAARARGWDARGVDLNPWAAEYAKNEVEVDVRCTSLEEAGFPDGAFDAVTAMDLIEHVGDPVPVLEEVGRLLKPSGVIALLTPDAGSPVSRILGVRWPEVQRVPEHLVLYSPKGLARLLGRHGFTVIGWHSIGKESDVRTLVSDVAPAAPRLAALAERMIGSGPIGDRVVDLDPRTKFCLYAVTADSSVSRPSSRVPRLPKKAPSAIPQAAVFEDLNALASADGLVSWMYDQYRSAVRGNVAEVGAGVGTFSAKMLEEGAEDLLLIEPDEPCAQVLDGMFSDNQRVRVAREFLPDAPSLANAAGHFDLIVCQNVLEHIHRDVAAVKAMTSALKPGGQLTLLVPAHARLYGPLDEGYGHYRRYERESLVAMLTSCGLGVSKVYSFNLLGVPGWWVAGLTGKSQIRPRALKVYEALLRRWRPLEDASTAPFGLSLIAHCCKPFDAETGAAR